MHPWSQRAGLAQDPTSEQPGQPALGHDIDVSAEQVLEVLGQGHLVEQAATGLEVNEEVEVAVGPASPRAKEPNTRRTRAPCRDTSRRTAASSSSVNGRVDTAMRALYEAFGVDVIGILALHLPDERFAA